jgi:hypothetical protein
MTRIAATFLVLLACGARLSAGPYDDLLKSVPPDANTLVLVNVKAAYASPLAKSEKWSEDYFKRYRAGIGFVPPDAEAVVVASEVNLSSMTRDHQIALVKVRNLPNMRDLAARSGGTTDRIADQVAALSPQDVYFVGLPSSVLGGVYPANRQASARWLRYALTTKSANLSPFLKRTSEQAGDDTIIVGVDLTDCADPTLLKLALPFSPAVVRQKNVNVELVSKFIASAEGMTVRIKIGEGITASVRVDFGMEVAQYKMIARELFLELLDYQGVGVAGIGAWETTYGEKSMTLSGSLRDVDMKRVLSLFAFPGPAAEDDPKVKPGEATVAATKRYLAACDAVLEDLRKAKDTADYLKSATWNEKAADQLDTLDRRAVDLVAVQAARDASKRLRALAGSLRGVPIDLEALASSAYAYGTSNVGWGRGWWGVRPVWVGGGSVTTNLPKVWAEQEKVIADDRKRRTEVWIQIDTIFSDARKKLEEKHKTRF